MDIQQGLSLIAVAILIGLTAFFVASEFAIVKIRSTQLEPHLEAGKASAKHAKKVTTHLDEYLSACQLGITITALGIGRLAEPTFEQMLHPFFEGVVPPAMVTTIAVIVSFSFATFLHVVIGELAPKTIAIQRAEQVTLLIARPLVWFYRLLYPFIWVLNGSARILIKLLGFKPMSEHEVTHSEEELRLIISDSYKGGEINQSEFKYVSKIFDFDNRLAKEIMVPRTEISAISIEDTLDDSLAIMREEKFTRYPVVNGDKDNILGIVNVREVLTDIVSPEVTKEVKLEHYIRPVISVIESIPVNDLLVEMQKKQTHMAILFDEYGGTAGLITAEDIIEEIVGEIRDEFDVEEDPLIRTIDEDHYLLDGKTLISDVNKLLHVELNEDEVDTIGGWVLTEKYDIEVGETMTFADYAFTVKAFDGHQIKLVEVIKHSDDKDVEDQYQAYGTS
ncbi:hemolysin family protein [Bacillus sp. Marseille-P3800]|uniref:hemolysin family protein n=1 Tax=Bacillus sp. Marseille-P3800 TaxID=2014782 RepID=UPI000C078DD3|nr:hemolysin family protein [Bacillus sp. Marseille-P3800]